MDFENQYLLYIILLFTYILYMYLSMIVVMAEIYKLLHTDSDYYHQNGCETGYQFSVSYIGT